MMVAKLKFSGLLVLFVGLAGCSGKNQESVRGSDKEDVSDITTRVISADGNTYSTKMQSARPISLLDSIQYVHVGNEDKPAEKVKEVRTEYSCQIEGQEERIEGEALQSGNTFPLISIIQSEWITSPDNRKISCSLTLFGLTRIGSSIRDLVIDLSFESKSAAGLEIQLPTTEDAEQIPFVHNLERSYTSVTGLRPTARVKLACLNTEYNEIENGKKSVLTLEELDKEGVAQSDHLEKHPAVDFCRVIQTNSQERLVAWSSWIKVESYGSHPPIMYDSQVRARDVRGEKYIEMGHAILRNDSPIATKYYAFKKSELTERSVRFWEMQNASHNFSWHPEAVKGQVQINQTNGDSRSEVTTREGEEIVYFAVSPDSSLNLDLSVASPVSNKCFRFIKKDRLGGVEINLSNGPINIYAYNPKANILGAQTHSLGTANSGLIRACWINCNDEFKDDARGSGSTGIPINCRAN